MASNEEDLTKTVKDLLNLSGMLAGSLRDALESEHYYHITYSGCDDACDHCKNYPDRIVKLDSIRAGIGDSRSSVERLESRLEKM